MHVRLYMHTRVNVHTGNHLINRVPSTGVQWCNFSYVLVGAVVTHCKRLTLNKVSETKEWMLCCSQYCGDGLMPTTNKPLKMTPVEQGTE